MSACEGCGQFVHAGLEVELEPFVSLSGPGRARVAHSECVDAAQAQIEDSTTALLRGLARQLAQPRPPALPRRARQQDIDPARLRTRTLYQADQDTLARIGAVAQGEEAP